MEMIRFLFAAFFLICGLVCMVSAVFGMFRFKYVLNRMNAAALIDTLALLLMNIGLVIATIYRYASSGEFSSGTVLTIFKIFFCRCCTYFFMLSKSPIITIQRNSIFDIFAFLEIMQIGLSVQYQIHYFFISFKRMICIL